MARIKIKDLSLQEDLAQEEQKGIRGGTLPSASDLDLPFGGNDPNPTTDENEPNSRSTGPQLIIGL
jgi:hypothetical protein